MCSNNNINYIPKPSRDQNPCIFYPNDTNISNTNKNILNVFGEKQANKIHVLKNTNNTLKLTKNQKYSQMTKGYNASRTKTFATQSQTYSNPNTNHFQRVGYSDAAYNNQIVGEPNNFAGPFQFNIPDPNGCSNALIQSGGNLLCGTNVNPCVSGDWYKPYPPILLSAEPGCDVVYLNWTTTNNPYAPITSFNIYQTTYGLQDTQLIESVSGTVTSYTVTNLINYIDLTNESPKYDFYITALSNNFESNISNTIQVSPIPFGAPTNFTAQSVYDASNCGGVKLNWDPPVDCSLNLSSYSLFFSNYQFIRNCPVTDLSYVVPNLKYDKLYSFFILSNGTNFVKSITVTCDPPFVLTPIPPPPLNFTGRSYCDNSKANVVLTWNSPSPCVTGYNLSCVDVSNVTINTNNIYNSYSFTDLSFNRQYDFSINSLDSLGNKSIVLTTSVYSTFSPPINFSGVGIYDPITSCADVSLSWVSPIDDCGIITSYGLYYSNNQPINTNIPPSQTSYLITGLYYKTNYGFKIQSNGINSVESPFVSLIVQTLIPPPPLDFSGNSGYTSSSGPQVALTWLSPSPCVNSYIVSCLNNGNSTVINQSTYPSIFSCTFSTLNYDTFYNFSVTSVDISGNTSVPVYLTNILTVPLSAPYNFLAIGIYDPTTNCPDCSLSWSASSPYNYGITGYSIFYSNGTYIADVLDNETNYLVTDLYYNTTYSFYIFANAYNDATSTYTFSPNATTPLLPPPLDFSGNSGYTSSSGPQVELTWVSPSPCVNSYNVSCSNGNSAVINQSTIANNISNTLGNTQFAYGIGGPTFDGSTNGNIAFTLNSSVINSNNLTLNVTSGYIYTGYVIYFNNLTTSIPIYITNISDLYSVSGTDCLISINQNITLLAGSAGSGYIVGNQIVWCATPNRLPYPSVPQVNALLSDAEWVNSNTESVIDGNMTYITNVIPQDDTNVNNIYILTISRPIPYEAQVAEYTYTPSTGTYIYPISLNDGYYEISDINLALQDTMYNNGHYYFNNETIYYPVSLSIYYPDNTFSCDQPYGGEVAPENIQNIYGTGANINTNYLQNSNFNNISITNNSYVSVANIYGWVQSSSDGATGLGRGTNSACVVAPPSSVNQYAIFQSNNTSASVSITSNYFYLYAGTYTLDMDIYKKNTGGGDLMNFTITGEGGATTQTLNPTGGSWTNPPLTFTQATDQYVYLTITYTTSNPSQPNYVCLSNLILKSTTPSQQPNGTLWKGGYAEQIADYNIPIIIFPNMFSQTSASFYGLKYTYYTNQYSLGNYLSSESNCAFNTSMGFGPPKYGLLMNPFDGMYTYTFASLNYDTSYNFSVTSVDIFGNESVPVYLTNIFRTLQLSAPSNFSAIGVYDSLNCASCNLYWSNSSPYNYGITGYSIFYSNGTYIADVLANQTNYLVTGLYYNTTYGFKVRTNAYNHATSSYSFSPNETTPLPPPPTNFSGNTSCNINNKDSAIITLSWTRPSSCVSRYFITKSAPYPNTYTVSNMTTIDIDVSYNTHYDFSINSVDISGNNSSIVALTNGITSIAANLPPTNFNSRVSMVYIPGIRLTWQSPSGSCAPITSWLIRYTSSNPVTNITFSVAAANTSVDISNVSLGASYNISIQSVSTTTTNNTYLSTEVTSSITLPVLYNVQNAQNLQNTITSISPNEYILILEPNNNTNNGTGTIRFNYSGLRVNLLMIGGGGSGYNYSNDSWGGGGGGFLDISFNTSTDNNNFTFTIGRGGNGSGGFGNDSSFNSTLTNILRLRAGGGGQGQTIGQNGIGYINDTSQNNTYGGNGGYYLGSAGGSYLISKIIYSSFTVQVSGGGGGGAVYGGTAGTGSGGSAGAYIYTYGESATSGKIYDNIYRYGSGGGGSARINNTNGGNGGKGAIILYWQTGLQP
jgi:hypothetical protein